MKRWRVFRDRLRALLFRERVVGEIREELDHHVEMRTAEYVRGGLSHEEARREAARRFGNQTLVQDRGYDVRGGGIVEDVFADIRYTLRMFRRNPGWTVATVATLAIGIGANTAIFAASRAILLRPLPYAEPDRLVMMWIGSRTSPQPVRGIVTPTHVNEWKARNASLADMAVVEQWIAQSELNGTDGPERLRISFASDNFFDLLGVRPALGRTFAATDRGDAPLVIVLSDRVWRRHFGADPHVIDQTIDLPIKPAGLFRTTHRVTIIGVLPPPFHFTYPDETEAWLPLSWPEIESPREGSVLRFQVVGRLKPGVTLATAQANMDTVNAAMSSDNSNPRLFQSFRSRVGESVIRLEPMQDWAVGRTRPAVTLLAVTTTFLLVVACVNVVSLLLARTVARSRELAIRAALGAGSGRVRRQLFTEGAVLAGMGGVVGLGAAMLLQPVLRSILPEAFPRIDEIGMDLSTVAWAAGLSTAVALAAGLVPGRGRSALDLQAFLKRGGQTTTGDRGAAKWRQVLVAGQVAVVVCLMIGSGLLLRTLWNLQRVDLGFDGSHVLMMELRQFDTKYFNAERRRLFQDELVARVSVLPGIVQAGLVNTVPLRNRPDGDRLLAMEAPTGRTRMHFRTADANYFSVMRIPLRRGRFYNEGETGAVVVSESAARVLFGGKDPIGQTLEAGPVVSTAQVVGVVADVRNQHLDEAGEPAFYAPPTHPQMGSNTVCLVVRTDLAVANLANAIRTVVHGLDPGQAIEEMTTMNQIVAASFADRRFYAVATIAFSLVALVLMIAGVYGVVSRGVSERAKELGVRIVLGATRWDLVGLVLRQGLLPVVAGLVGGGVMAAWLSRLLHGLMFGVGTLDPSTYAAVPLLIVLVATIACYLPARRALRVNPIETLRAE